MEKAGGNGERGLQGGGSATWETRKRAEITTFMIFAFHNMGVLTT